MRFLSRYKVRIGLTLLVLALMFVALLVVNDLGNSARPLVYNIQSLLGFADEDPFMASAIENTPFTSLTYSIQAFSWWDATEAGLHLDWVRLMSFSHVKQSFAWQDVEITHGNWRFYEADIMLDRIEARGLKVIARLGGTPTWAYTTDKTDFLDIPPDDLSDWGNFCSMVATRYKGRIAGYQIWNEPNLTREWGGELPDPAGYVELLKVCSEAIRTADPDAVLISAGLSPTGNMDAIATRDDVYLDQMYNAGFQQYVDVVGVHAPGYSEPSYGPDDAERDGIGRWASFRRIEDLRKIMIQHNDAGRQMAILEMGWTTDPIHPTYSWFAVDEATQARYLLEAFDYAVENWRPWVGLVSVIYMPKPTWTEDDEEYWWAISTPDKGHRQAFFDLANMAKYCGDFIIPERAPDSPEALGLVPAPTCS